MGLELTTLRSRVTCSTNWASQVPCGTSFYVCLFVLSLFIFEREKKREAAHMLVGEGQRERGTEDLKWALCWRQRARYRAWTHEPWAHDLSRREDGCLTDWATQAPIFLNVYLPWVYLVWWGVCWHLWPIFLIGLSVFLLLSFKSSLYILDKSPLSDMHL